MKQKAAVEAAFRGLKDGKRDERKKKKEADSSDESDDGKTGEMEKYVKLSFYTQTSVPINRIVIRSYMTPAFWSQTVLPKVFPRHKTKEG